MGLLLENKQEKNIRPIHYLGSKLRILDKIKSAIDYVDSTGGTMCDLFAGSGTVATYMAQYRNIVAVDIQEYSKILCEASLKEIQKPVDSEEIINAILNHPKTKLLNECFNGLISYENESFINAVEGKPYDLYEIIEKGSIYAFTETHQNKDFSKNLYFVLDKLQNKLDKYNLSSSKEIMITRYFGGIYFSYKQALMMDFIANVISEQSGLLKTKMLAALLSTASEVVNTIGKQFAQPLKVKKKDGKLKLSLLKKIFLDRSFNVIEIYSRWMEYYLNCGYSIDKSKVICTDYVEALDLLKKSNISVIYADPPYTRYHYSRYYHVLETICLHDNPRISTTFPGGKGGLSRGMYRENRHQSPFCIKSKAEQAFNQLFEKVCALDVPLVLSYSPFNENSKEAPRVEKISELTTLANRYYNKVEVIDINDFAHSKLNQTEKNFEKYTNSESLIVCTQR